MAYIRYQVVIDVYEPGAPWKTPGQMEKYYQKIHSLMKIQLLKVPNVYEWGILMSEVRQAQYKHWNWGKKP
jgi:hypothetical protein